MRFSVAAACLMGVAAIGFAGCGGDQESGAEESLRRTGGIFGGSVQPRGASGGETSVGTERAGENGSASDPSTAPDVGQSRAEAASGRPGAPTGDGSIDFSGMGYTTGSPSAPIRVIEFSDFGCGFCRRFHLETYPTLRDEYVETGRVVWKYIPFVLGIFPNGEEAALAGECVLDQGGNEFPAFRDHLFEDQSSWREAEEPTEVFVRVAESAGADGGRLRRCIEEGSTAERVARNNEVGRRVGVRGTPSFLVNGAPLQGAQPMAVFRSVFEQLLEMEAERGGGS